MATQQASRDAEAMDLAALRAEVEQLHAPVEPAPVIPTVQAGLLGVTLSGYLQSDGVLYRQSSEDELNPSTGEPLNQTRFLIRRARLRADLTAPWVSGALELDANTVHGPAARIQAAEVAIRYQPDPDRLPLAKATIGLFKIPFGYEVLQSDRDRLFLERSNAENALFPGEYDLGAMVSGGWNFLRYSVALMNGHPIGEKAYPGRDPISPKDLVGRVGVDTRLESVGIVAGAYSGARLGGPVGDRLAWLGLDPDLAEEAGFVLVIALTTYASLVVGELVPKQFALRAAESIAVIVAPPMAALARIAAPIVWLLDTSSSLLLRLLGIRRERSAGISAEELQMLFAEATHHGVIEEQERAMLSGIMRLADRPVRELMTPRTELDWIDINASQDEIRQDIAASPHSQLPVADGSADKILGVVKVREVLAVLLSVFNAYALGIGRIKGRIWLLALLLLANTLPQEALVYPLYYLAKQFGIYDTRLSVIIVFTVVQSAFGAYLLSSVMSAFPRPLLEAARIDGANRWQVLWRVVVPVVRPTLSVLLVFFFVWTWNEFLIPMVFLISNENQTVSVALGVLQGQRLMDATMSSAAALLGLLPTVVFFLIFQRTLSRGLTAGAIK